MSSSFSINNRSIHSSIVPSNKRTKEEMGEGITVVTHESTSKKKTSDTLNQPKSDIPSLEKNSSLFSPLSQLDSDLQINIAEYLSFKDITPLCNSNQTFNTLLNNIKNEKK